MRKVYVYVQTRLIIRANEDIKISDVINDMAYSFQSQTIGADVEDSEICDYEIKDSK